MTMVSTLQAIAGLVFFLWGLHDVLQPEDPDRQNDRGWFRMSDLDRRVAGVFYAAVGIWLFLAGVGIL